MSTSKVLRSLYSSGVSSPDLLPNLYCLIRNDEEEKYIASLRGSELSRVVDFLDKALDAIPVTDDVAWQCLRKLRTICAERGILPLSYNVSGKVSRDGAGPVASGGLSDVWVGVYGKRKVCIKCLKTYQNNLRSSEKMFCEEAVMWKRLKHPNIVAFIGITRDPMQFVSEWMPNGTVTSYLRKNPAADRVYLLLDVAEGLAFLHANHTVHGDLKGPNVLIDYSGHARLTDFGLASVPWGLESADLNELKGCTPRWAAPEILIADGGGATREADVFSFGMVVVEVFTGDPPFSTSNDFVAVRKILDGERPNRPKTPGLTDSIWNMALRCFLQDPAQRPTIAKTVGVLREYRRLHTTNPRPSTLAAPPPVGPESSIVVNINIPAWKRLCSHDLLPREAISLVKAIFTNGDEVKVICGLSGDDAQAAIDAIHKTLDLPDLPPRLRVKCLSALCRICSRQALFPTSLKIPMCYDQSGAPRYRGGFADVWKGEHQGRDVAVKVLRVYSTSDLAEVTKMFYKEVVTWNALRHPNVLPLLGVIANEGQFAMVSEWMTDGNINEFIKARGEVNRFELLQDVAIGLIYIHDLEMIHGDLKGLNILIDKNGRARLADFGLLKIVSNPTYFTASSAASTGGTLRWMSPELLDPEQYDMDNDHPTKESDCYALGMVIYETLTGQPPFALLKVKDHIFKQKVLRGERPGRPEGAIGALFMDELWEMLGRCWASQAQSRPKIGDVLECLKQVSDTWKPLPVNEDVRVDDDGWDLTAESLLTKLTLNAS